MSVIFAGMNLSSKGCSQDPHKMRALLDLPAPENIKQVQSLIGAIAQFQLWFPDLTATRTNITTLLMKNKTLFGQKNVQ